MFVLIALVLSLATAIYFWQKRAFSYWTDRGIPQLKPKFPLGTIQMHRHYAYQMEEAYNAYKDKSKYVGMYNSLLPLLLIVDHDVIKTILTTDYDSMASHGTYYNEKDDPISAHLFAIDGQRWKSIRQKLNTYFTPTKIKMSAPTLVDISQRLIESIEAKLGNGEKGIDMNDMFAKYTIDCVGNYGFGVECNSFHDPTEIFRKMTAKVCEEDLTAVKMFTLGAFPNLARRLGFKVISPDVSDFCKKIVCENIEHREKNNIKRNDLLDIMMSLRNKDKSNSYEDCHKEGLSTNEIAAHFFTFFGAGYETSASSSTFTLFELARNQDVQDKLRSHIRAVLKKHNGEMTYEAIKDMTYLEQCYKEGLRMYPPFAVLLRRVTKPYKLPDTNVVLPVGTDVAVSVYAVQRDADVYPNPEQFDPDRFTPEEEAKRPFGSYLPFGEGPRVCIGRRIGILQVKIAFAKLIGNYRFTLNPKSTKEIIFDKDAVASIAHGLYFDVERVD